MIEIDSIVQGDAGAGTTCLVAKKLNRHYIGIEPKQEYKEMADNRIANYQEKPKRLRVSKEVQPELALSLAGG
jgi:DNA modification methylase